MQLNNPGNISDDQELAQALAGVNKDTLPFEETAPTAQIQTKPDNVQSSVPTSTPTEDQVPEPAAVNPLNTGMPPELANDLPNRNNLDDVKINAINELRPLIEKLTIPPEEKFDTYLLLIRTTDDKELVSPAYEIAKQIEDDSRRAMALLDIIKEIDYLSNKSAKDTVK